MKRHTLICLFFKISMLMDREKYYLKKKLKMSMLMDREKE
jgi:hypothetical protein